MNIVVILRMVPDTVEELEISEDRKSLDPDLLRYKLSDPDEHALEQGVLLKEHYGGSVTAAAVDAPEVDDVLYTALARGADRAVKLMGVEAPFRSRGAATVATAYIRAQAEPVPKETLILTCSQAIDDLDGEMGSFVADQLRLPFVSVVTGVRAEGDQLTVLKEFAGGLRGEFTLAMPAVLGVQSAEKPPRYVPIAKIRAAMKTGEIESFEMSGDGDQPEISIGALRKPEPGRRATMLEGSPEEVADQIVEVLAKNSLP